MAAISWLLPYQGPLKDSKDKLPEFSAFFAEKGAARNSGCFGRGEEFPTGGRRGIPVVWGAARNFQQGGGEVFQLFGGWREISNRAWRGIPVVWRAARNFFWGGPYPVSSLILAPVDQSLSTLGCLLLVAKRRALHLPFPVALVANVQSWLGSLNLGIIGGELF